MLRWFFQSLSSAPEEHRFPEKQSHAYFFTQDLPLMTELRPQHPSQGFQRLRALFSTPAPTQKCKTPWPRDTWAKTVSDEYELKNSVPLQVSWTLLIIQSTACDWLWWGFYHGTLYQTQRDDLWASNTNPISHSYPGLVPLNGILTFPECFRRKWLSVST